MHFTIYCLAFYRFFFYVLRLLASGMKLTLHAACESDKLKFN